MAKKKHIVWQRCWRSLKHLDQRGMNVESNLSLKFSHGHLLNKRNKDLLQNLHVFVIQTNLPSGLAPRTCKVCLLRKFLQNSFQLVLQHNVHSKFLEKFGKFHVTSYMKLSSWVLLCGWPPRWGWWIPRSNKAITSACWCDPWELHQIRCCSPGWRPHLRFKHWDTRNCSNTSACLVYTRAYWIGLYRYDMYMEYTRYPC